MLEDVVNISNAFTRIRFEFLICNRIRNIYNTGLKLCGLNKLFSISVLNLYLAGLKPSEFQ